jgi:hypothetical protein
LNYHSLITKPLILSPKILFMLKYLQGTYDVLAGLKTGIQRNLAKWSGQPDSPATVQSDIDEILTIHGELEMLKSQLKQKQQQARALNSRLKIKAGQTAARAAGIHADEFQKLAEYNLARSSKGAKRPVPRKAIIKIIDRDDDGIGFKLKVQRLEHVDYFEWQKGIVPGNVAGVLQPPYPFWRSSGKQNVVDNDVEAGQRCFYRVRGVNSTGPGEWSEPVNGVQ